MANWKQILARVLRNAALFSPLVFLLLFFGYPLAAIVGRSFAAGADGLVTVLHEPYYRALVWFTTWQAALSTVLTLATALPAAFVFARYEFRGKNVLRALATVPFVLPTVVVAVAFAALLGPRGLLNSWLQALFDLAQPPIRLQQTLALVLLAHVFYNYSVVLRLVGGFWSNLDPRLEEAAALLGANRLRVFLGVTLPLLLPALGAAALLVFIFTFTSFGVIVILGGPRIATIEVEIYRQTAQLLRLDIAAALALIQLACTLVFSLLYTRLAARSSVPLELRPRRGVTRRPQSTAARLAVGANILVLLLLLVTPLVALALRSLTAVGDGLSLAAYAALGRNPTGSVFYVPPVEAIRNSLLFAGLTVGVALGLGLAAAYLLGGPGRVTGRRAPSARPRLLQIGRGLLDALFMLPLGASAVTLGLGLLVALSVAPLAALRTSPLLVVIAHTLVALPFVVRAVLPVLRGLDPRLREAAAILGAPRRRVWREIDLPLLFPALLTGAVFAFTVSLGEFGATLLLARPDYPTLPLVIYRFLGQPGAINYGQALALSTILMLTTALSFLVLERVRYRELGEF